MPPKRKKAPLTLRKKRRPVKKVEAATLQREEIVKTHKKFGKFHCLSEEIEIEEKRQDEEDNTECIEIPDEAEEIAQKIADPETSEHEPEAATDVEEDHTIEAAVSSVCEDAILEGEERIIVEDYVEEDLEEEPNVTTAPPVVEVLDDKAEIEEVKESKVESIIEEEIKEILTNEESVKGAPKFEDIVDESPKFEGDNEDKPKPPPVVSLIPSRKSKRISLKAERLKPFMITNNKLKDSDVEEGNSSGNKSDASSESSHSSKNKSESSNTSKTKEESPSVEIETDDKSSTEQPTSGSEDAPPILPDDKSELEEKAMKAPTNKTKTMVPKQVKKKMIKNEPGKSVKRKPTVATSKLKILPRGKRIIKKKKLGHYEKSDEDENSIRRSTRIKTISSQKKKSKMKGKGLVKKEADNSDNSNSGNGEEKMARESPSFVTPTEEVDHKPVKVKSRWRRSSELEMTAQSKVQDLMCATVPLATVGGERMRKVIDEEVERRLKQFTHLKENQYLTERISCKEAKKMTCDCFLTEGEIEEGDFGCGEDCLNRLLMIECGNLCTVGDRCTNKRFQKGHHASCEVFRTDKKGLGIRASANIPYGEFILEYVGEVLDPDEFDKRATEYSKDKNQHYYFMSLRADAVIDATQKGNISRFINHSCDPNAETQKWTVNGELRIGFFSKKTILAGEEITFDYQFQRYGKEAQKCFCEAPICRGWLGEEPDDDEDEEEEEEEEEEEDEDEDAEEKGEKVEASKKEISEMKIESIVDEVKEKEVVVGGEAVVKLDGEIKEKDLKKKEKTPRKVKVLKMLKPKRTRKEFFEDLDLDDEIATLQTTGLKNQAHTLKLSRLMVRAKESGQRTKLLKLLKRGEVPCRRLFLDYHGLRLIHGWMTDTQHPNKENEDTMNCLRLDILQTLVMLPIPNKTMLQDSKVLPTVEKWAVSGKPAESPTDSETSSPKVVEAEPPEPVKVAEEIKVEVKIEEEDEFEIRRSVGMEHKQIPKFTSTKNIIEELSNIFDDDMDISPIEPFEEVKEVVKAPVKENEYNLVEEILALAGKLLKEWSSLKEVFRIPKKERIEQMKEHEREADKRYKALSLEQENMDKKRDRYKQMYRGKDDRGRKERILQQFPRISKHERRKLFAMQVEQVEAERRRKQQDLWNQHVKNCMMIGTDPRFTAPFDPSRGYQCIWNPQLGQWQNYPIPEQNVIYNQSMGMQHMQNANFPFIPPILPPPQPSHGQAQGINMAPQNIPTNMTPHKSIMSPHNPTMAAHNASMNPHNPIMSPHNSNMNMTNPNVSHNPNMPNISHNLNIPPPNPNLTNIPLHNATMPTHNSNIGSLNSNIGTLVNMTKHNLNMPSHNPNVPPHNSINRPLNTNIPPPNLNIPPRGIPNQNLALHNLPPPQTGLPPRPSIHHLQTRPPETKLQIPQSPQINMPQALLPPNISQPCMPAASMGTMPPMPNIPAMPSHPYKGEREDSLQAKFIGPIPPPVKLPPKWKCAKDKYGRPYYYHIKIRQSQWEPPELLTEEFNYLSDSSSSSESSSLSSDSSSEDSDSDDIDDTRLMLEIRNKFKKMEAQKKMDMKKDDTKMAMDDDSILEETSLLIDNSIMEEKLLAGEQEATTPDPFEETLSSLDKRLIEELGLMKEDPPAKKRRVGLVQEIIISPRTEEDRLQFREDVKRYKQNKEKLRREKDIISMHSKKSIKPETEGESPSTPTTSTAIDRTTKVPKKRVSTRSKLKEMEMNSESSKKIKESFRSGMAGVMVHILNAYRKPDCKEGKITNTEDFKHLARKLTHFVMLKELKHCQKMEDLTVTESVKLKAREFVRKYMSKFGETYQRPADDLENY